MSSWTHIPLLAPKTFPGSTNPTRRPKVVVRKVIKKGAKPTKPAEIQSVEACVTNRPIDSIVIRFHCNEQQIVIPKDGPQITRGHWSSTACVLSFFKFVHGFLTWSETILWTWSQPYCPEGVSSLFHLEPRWLRWFHSPDGNQRPAWEVQHYWPGGFWNKDGNRSCEDGLRGLMGSWWADGQWEPFNRTTRPCSNFQRWQNSSDYLPWYLHSSKLNDEIWWNEKLHDIHL